jgi:hypothetical protein
MKVRQKINRAQRRACELEPVHDRERCPVVGRQFFVQRAGAGCSKIPDSLLHPKPLSFRFLVRWTVDYLGRRRLARVFHEHAVHVPHWPFKKVCHFLAFPVRPTCFIPEHTFVVAILLLHVHNIFVVVIIFHVHNISAIGIAVLVIGATTGIIIFPPNLITIAAR